MPQSVLLTPRALMRLWLVARACLSRPSAGAALAVALLFGVAEPALCIFHCQLWLPSHATHASHHHALPSGPERAVVAALRAAGPSCFMHRGAAPDAPMPAPPSPVREAALSALALLAIVQCSSLAARPAPAATPFRWLDPPLRPPARAR